MTSKFAQKSHKMKAHYMDVLIVLFALFGAGLVVVLDSMVNPQTTKGPSVECLSPNDFSPSWIEYTEATCTASWLRGDVYDGYNRLPSSEGPQKRGRRPEWLSSSGIPRKGDNLLRSVLSQAIVAVVLFVLLQTVLQILVSKSAGNGHAQDSRPDVTGGEEVKAFNVTTTSGHPSDGANQSRTWIWTVLYCVLLVLGIVAWATLAGVSGNIRRAHQPALKTVEVCDPTNRDKKCTTETVPHSADIFLCDFAVRKLGNIHRYTVQCVGTPPAPEVATGEGQLPVTVNTGVCVTMTILLLLHLVSTVILALIGGAKKRPGALLLATVQ